MVIRTYDVLVLLHVLAFVYWLGADLAVFYAAKFGADRRLSLETRRTILDIMAFVDLGPRLSVPLIGATGVTMAFRTGGLELHASWIWFTWIAALLWVAISLFIYRNRREPDRIRSVMRFDVFWRLLLLVAIAGVAMASVLGVGITASVSLTAKLLLYALAIALSLVLKLLFLPYRPALGRIAVGEDNEANSAIMNAALARTRPVIISIWVITIVEAAIGLWA